MPTDQLLVLAQPQRDRPAFAEWCVRFIGKIRYQHLASRFGIHSAAATANLAADMDRASANIDQGANAESYGLGPHLRLPFALPSERVPSWLNQGFGDGESVEFDACVPSQTPERLIQLDLTTLAYLPRATPQARPLDTECHSIASGRAHREIVPLVLLHNGRAGCVRVHDRKAKVFRLRLKRPLAIYSAKDAMPASGYPSQPDQQRQEPAPSEGSYEDA